MRTIGFAFILLFGFAHANAQSIIGKWKTIDDKTGKARSIVEFYEKNGQIFGKIIQGFDSDVEKQICDKCTDDRKNQKIIGLEIVRNMTKSGSEWKDGEILDPEDGKKYDCKIWLEGGNLKVRGYVAFFYRTQTWLKAN